MIIEIIGYFIFCSVLGYWTNNRIFNKILMSVCFMGIALIMITSPQDFSSSYSSFEDILKLLSSIAGFNFGKYIIPLINRRLFENE